MQILHAKYGIYKLCFLFFFGRMELVELALCYLIFISTVHKAVIMIITLKVVKSGLTSTNLAIRVRIKYFLRSEGWD